MRPRWGPGPGRVAALLALVALAAVAVLVVVDPFASVPGERAAPAPSVSGPPPSVPPGSSAGTSPNGVATTAPAQERPDAASSPAAPPPTATAAPGVAGDSPLGRGLHTEPIPGLEPVPGTTPSGAESPTIADRAAGSQSASQQITVVVPCVLPEVQGCPVQDAVSATVPRAPAIGSTPSWALFGIAAIGRSRRTRRRSSRAR
jgi:hypothetical protein